MKYAPIDNLNNAKINQNIQTVAKIRKKIIWAPCPY
jgi:hypothetical protein